MHKHFGTWYRVAGIKPDGNLLTLRWKGVEAFSRQMRIADVFDTVKLFFGLMPQGSFIERFREAFFAADPGFEMRGNDMELSVLAGACVASIIEDSNALLTDLSSLIVVTINCRGLGPNPSVPDIADLAQAAISRRSGDRWAGTDLADATFPAVKQDAFSSQIKEACKSANPQQMESHLLGLQEKIASVLGDLASGMEAVRSATAKRLDLLAEETNILWWLLGKHSRDLDKCFDQMDPAAACVVAGRELADLVTVIPGPPAALAFLGKIIQDPTESVSIADAIGKTPRQWRAKLLPPEVQPIEAFCPVLAGIRKSLEATGNEWIGTFEHTARLTTNANLPRVSLSLQVYLEALASKAVDLVTEES